MAFNVPVFIAVVSAVVGAVATAVAQRALLERPRLISFMLNASAVTLPPQPGANAVTVNSHSIVLRNAGRKSANNVRMGHAILPAFSVFPQLQYRVDALPGGGSEIVFPMLVPNEQVTITFLYFAPLVWNQISIMSPRSDEGLAKVVTAISTPQLAAWLVRALWALITVGAATTIYWLVLLVRGLWIVVESR
jgi:hypothetical protein